MVTLGATSLPAAATHGADLSRADPGVAVLHAAKTLIGSAGLPSAVVTREPTCAADAFWKMPHKGLCFCSINNLKLYSTLQFLFSIKMQLNIGGSTFKYHQNHQKKNSSKKNETNYFIVYICIGNTEKMNTEPTYKNDYLELRSAYPINPTYRKMCG